VCDRPGWSSEPAPDPPTPDAPGGVFGRVIGDGDGDNNGSTHPDFTSYIERAPVSALAPLLWLEADRMKALADDTRTPSIATTTATHLAHPVEYDRRQVGAGGLDGLPVMPARGEIPVFAQLHFFEVERQCIGELNLQLL